MSNLCCTNFRGFAILSVKLLSWLVKVVSKPYWWQEAPGNLLLVSHQQDLMKRKSLLFDVIIHEKLVLVLIYRFGIFQGLQVVTLCFMFLLGKRIEMWLTRNSHATLLSMLKENISFLGTAFGFYICLIKFVCLFVCLKYILPPAVLVFQWFYSGEQGWLEGTQEQHQDFFPCGKGLHSEIWQTPNYPIISKYVFPVLLKVFLIFLCYQLY